MTRWVLMVLACVLPGLLSAQTVSVRSGEHGDFTRLVLTLPDGTDWNITPDPDQERLQVSFSGQDLQFDTSRVFDRIGKERITEVAPSEDGAGLTIGLACDCSASSFVLRDNMLVIDVAPNDGDNPRVSAERTTATKTFVPPLDPRDAALARDLSEIRFGSMPGLGPEPQQNPLLPLLPSVAAGARTARFADDVVDADFPVSQGLGRQIAANIAVAATAGILDPAVQLPLMEPEQTDPAPEPKSQAPHTPRHGDLARQLATGLTALDHDALQGGHIAVGGDTCVDDTKIAVHTWAKPDAEPSRVLAEQRGKVFGEFDRINSEALDSYAKALIHFGFGAEARTILSLGDGSADVVKLSLSYLVDREPDPMQTFADSARCAGYSSFWFAVSGVPEKDAPPLNMAAVIRTFETLPKHLRSHLGPTLVENLTAAGYPDGARDILRRLQRMEGGETDSIALGKAHLDIKTGDLATAGKRLHDLSIKGGPEAADAIVASIDLADVSDTRVPTRIVELSEAFATELRNSEDGEKLWESYVRSLLVNRAFDAAFAELDSRESVSDDTAQKMEQVALRALWQDADDVTFLKIAVRFLEQGDLPEQATLSIGIAERFLSLGLPALALRQLDAKPIADNLSDARVLKAKALLALSQPEDAEIILIGERGEEVAKLRAEARRQMGDHVFARTLFADVGDQSAALRSAWLSGAWQDVSDSDSALAPAAALMQREPAAPTETVDRLSAVDTLTTESARSRETLRALLDATAVPELD